MQNPLLNNNQNASDGQYFSSLPPVVQATIKQCGIQFSSEEELRGYAEKLMCQSGPTQS